MGQLFAAAQDFVGDKRTDDDAAAVARGMLFDIAHALVASDARSFTTPWPGTSRSASRPGMDDYLSKPFRPENLLDALRRAGAARSG